jgi:hypothetical protein
MIIELTLYISLLLALLLLAFSVRLGLTMYQTV